MHYAYKMCIFRFVCMFTYMFLYIIFIHLAEGGGSGFIGRHLTKVLKDKGMTVTMVSREAGPSRITWVSVCCNSLCT